MDLYIISAHFPFAFVRNLREMCFPRVNLTNFSFLFGGRGEIFQICDITKLKLNFNSN
jgi:hypothetical protein